MNASDLYPRRLRNQIFLQRYLQRRLIPLSAFAGSLLLRLIAGHLLIEITFTLAAGGRLCAIDTKIFGDEILIDLVFEDQAPFAESLYGHQQDE